MNRTETGSMKWDRTYIQKRFGETPEKIYPFFIADMDYKIPETVNRKVKKAFTESDFGYFNVSDGYFESVINWYQKRHNIAIKKEWILPSVGTVSAMHFAVAPFGKKTNFLIFTPVYGVFSHIAKTFGSLHAMPLENKGNRYYIDYEELEKRIIKDEIETIIFCNPHNPSGRMWTFEELQKLVDLCKKHEVLLLSDEIHGELNLGIKPFHSLIEFTEQYDKIVVSSSANKAFNLSGLSSSYLLINNQELYDKIEAEHDSYHITPNRVGLKYTETVYTEGEEWLDELLKQVQQNIDYAIERLDDQELAIFKPESSYLIWMKLHKVSDGEQFVRELAQATGVLLETGSRFIADYEQHVRINVATSQELFKEGIEKFKLFYEAYNEEESK